MLSKGRGVQPSHTLDLKFAEIEKRGELLLSSNLQGDEKRKGGWGSSWFWKGTSDNDCESECVDWLSKGGVVGGFNSRGRLTLLKGGRLEGWRERGIQSGVEG